MPASRAERWAVASWASVSQARRLWKSTRSINSPRARAVSGERGSRRPAGQRCHSGAVHLGERAPGGVVLQRLALLGEEVDVRGPPPGPERHRAHQFQRLALELPHGVAVDQRALVQHGFAQPRGAAPAAHAPGRGRST